MQKQHFVVRYLREHFSTSAVDQLFHELWRDKFGGAYKSANWGAEMSYGAMRQLKRMYDRNMLERGVVRLGTNWQPGFPRWVYGYTLKEFMKE